MDERGPGAFPVQNDREPRPPAMSTTTAPEPRPPAEVQPAASPDMSHLLTVVVSVVTVAALYLAR